MVHVGVELYFIGLYIVAVPTADNEILEAATSFKIALDAIDRTHWERVHIDRYPRGACGHCAELLARYLNDRFGITPEYVSRWFYNHPDIEDGSHAWLEWCGLIIDISGDQFGWPPVIVSRDLTEHHHGVEEQRHTWCFDAAWWGNQCAGIWQAVMERISASA